MSLNDKSASALRRELAKCFPERAPDDAGHGRLADALSDTARHTQGDWLLSGSFITNDSGTAVIAKVANTADTHLVWQCSTASLENSANARLIAAAPELLEACKALAITLEEMWAEKELTAPKFRQCQLGEAVKDARAAIARAEGGAA